MPETVETEFRPTLGRYQFETPISQLFASQAEAHDLLLKCFFEAIREAEKEGYPRWSNKRSIREFQKVWGIWKMYCPKEPS